MAADGNKRILHTVSEKTITVDGVVAGIGIKPNVSLAQDAGLGIGDGIITAADLTAGAHNIYAAGDCASFVSPATGMLTRLEHEDNALKMGKAAGLSMAGQDIRYEYLPMFYSDLFELGYEAVGQVNSKFEVFADWQEEYVTGVLYYLQEGRVRGVLLWNVWDKTDEARLLIMDPGPFNSTNLAGRITAD
jgi:NADPH-dependent 2,4-dienoyl-CoA reductase/sulfur reductase-like enzyme